MPFEKGQPKTPGSGRKAGTPNKSTQLRVEEFLEAKGVQALEQVYKLLTEGSMFDSDKARIWLQLYSYCHPKPRELTIFEPPPPEDDNEPKKTFEEFCKAADYPVPYPKQHDIRAWLFDDEVREPRLLLGSRGYGKTDYGTLLGSAYEIYRKPQETSILLVTKSPERNASILREVAAALEKNGVSLEVENAKELRVPSLIGKDNSLSAVSVGASSFRGRHPGLVIMDDPVTPEDSREKARERVKVVYDELYKLCKNIVIIGQPVHKFDLYEELRPQLVKLELPYGSIPELDPDLDAMRLAGITEETIQASYFLNVKAAKTNPFDDIKFIDAMPAGETLGFIDPSFTGVDYTALTVGRGHFDGVAVQGHVWQRAWYHCIEEIAQRCVELKVTKLCIETNSLGEQPVVQARAALAKLGVTVGVQGRHSSGFKDSRIQAAGNFAASIHLSRRSDRVYSDQVVKYEYGAKHDDAPDSLASLLAWVGLIKGKETGR